VAARFSFERVKKITKKRNCQNRKVYRRFRLPKRSILSLHLSLVFWFLSGEFFLLDAGRPTSHPEFVNRVLVAVSHMRDRRLARPLPVSSFSKGRLFSSSHATSGFNRKKKKKSDRTLRAPARSYSVATMHSLPNHLGARARRLKSIGPAQAANRFFQDSHFTEFFIFIFPTKNAVDLTMLRVAVVLLLALLAAPTAVKADCLSNAELSAKLTALQSALGAAEYGSLPGQFSFFNISSCELTGQSCNFQNPTSPYGFVQLPNNPAQPPLPGSLPQLVVNGSWRLLASYVSFLFPVWFSFNSRTRALARGGQGRCHHRRLHAPSVAVLCVHSVCDHALHRGYKYVDQHLRLDGRQCQPGLCSDVWKRRLCGKQPVGVCLY